jgi:hypothetical protein
VGILVLWQIGCRGNGDRWADFAKRCCLELDSIHHRTHLGANCHSYIMEIVVCGGLWSMDLGNMKATKD